MRAEKHALMWVLVCSLFAGIGTLGMPSIVKAKNSYKKSSSSAVWQGRKTRQTVRIENRKNVAEFSRQHKMIKDDLSDVQAAIQADLAKLQATVEALEPGTGGPGCGPGTQVGRFVINAGEACDTSTGLKWQQAPDPTMRNHADALNHCTSLGGGYHLPNIHELHSVLDYGHVNPTLTPGVFSNINGLGFYWSSTSAAESSDFAWMIRVETGNVPAALKTDDRNVLCVR